MTSLTPRELEVTELAARGLTRAEMAKAMYVSTSTVKAHLEHAAGKLGARNRAHLVALAYRSGLLEVDRG